MIFDFETSENESIVCKLKNVKKTLTLCREIKHLQSKSLIRLKKAYLNVSFRCAMKNAV